MKISDEIKKDDLLVAKLACAYTLLSLAPYAHWRHEGSPAEMAAYVVETARKEGKLGFLERIINQNGAY